MSDGPSCQGCGATLASPDAICTRCEAELTAEPPRPPGKYICPQCQASFATLARVSWPRQVPWWRPTTIRLQCPHCDAPLRDRHAVQPPAWLLGAIVAVAIGVQLFATGWQRLLLILLLVALYAPLFLSAWRSRRDSDNPHRFVMGTTSFWAQGNEKLELAVKRLRQRRDGPSD